MSIILESFSMPERCGSCPCYVYNGYCKAKELRLSEMERRRPDWCTLVALPEKHGRLIDADSMISQLMEIKNEEEKEPNNLSLYTVGFIVRMLSEQFVVVDKEIG